LSDNINRLAPFFRIIESRLEELDSDIALTAREAFKDSSTQILNENGAEPVVPPDLEKALYHHSSPEIFSLKEVAHTLPWTPTKTIAKENPNLANVAAVELIGPTGVAANEEVRSGLILLPAFTHYPKHRHAAEELYLVLSGTALWGQNKTEPTPRPPGSFCHHASWEWHEMITSADPLLCLWFWTGDIRFNQYQISHI
jgi:hypothetical protein